MSTLNVFAATSLRYFCPYRAWISSRGPDHHDGNYYPELQINFACGSTPQLEGTELSLIAEMGEVDLKDINLYNATTPKWQVGHSYDFRKAAPIKENVTYALMLNTFKYRGLLVFKVLSYKYDVLTIEYATRVYSLITETKKSEFIPHEQKNQR